GPTDAGKSTALKLLAGILRPDAGTIDIRGRLAALIEVGAGMHGDLTGLENIYLSGAVVGMSRQEIRRKLDDIVAFSGLEKFLDTPVKRYSTGMQARLGFSTAAFVNPDVLLVDEVLSVGDAVFRHRCEQRMSELVRGGTTLIFVTHNLEQMRKVCHRALVLDKGVRSYIGAPADAVAHYLQATMNAEGRVSYADQPAEGDLAAEVIDVRYGAGDGKPLTCAVVDEPVLVQVRLRVARRLPRLAVQVALRHIGGELFVSMNSQQRDVFFDLAPGMHEVTLRLPTLPVASGSYYAQVRLWDAAECKLVKETPFRYPLQVEDSGQGTGMLALPHAWSAPVMLEAQPLEAPVGQPEPAFI
ncbi:MAG TPA: ATP-binding cassette domain-containing protein, partial [Phycisphaerae bacterium]|nr:ATP-binding cassette domain-containing protein [Phycisphaerae bacterium]